MNKQAMRHVREALLRWDAIGVADAPEAVDEYDCMIGPLLHQLNAGDSASKIASWIDSERVAHFGLGRDECSDKALADDLWHWWRTLG